VHSPLVNVYPELQVAHFEQSETLYPWLYVAESPLFEKVAQAATSQKSVPTRLKRQPRQSQRDKPCVGVCLPMPLRSVVTPANRTGGAGAKVQAGAADLAKVVGGADRRAASSASRRARARRASQGRRTRGCTLRGSKGKENREHSKAESHSGENGEGT
jgi:hypothetical protein